MCTHIVDGVPVNHDEDEDEGSSSDSDNNSNNEKTSSIKLKSHDLVVHINSTEDLDTMSRVADEHMRQMQKAALIGEYEVLEESETLFDVIGGR